MLTVHRLLGRFLSCLSVLVLFVTLVGAAWLHYLGEQHWLTAALLYVPSGVWLLPVLGLIPLCVVFCFRWALVLGFFALGYVWLFMGYEWHQTAVPEGQGGEAIRILSNNVGNNAKTTVAAFAAEFRPDVYVFQESRPGGYYAEVYPDLEVHKHGEFVLVTGLNVLEADFLDQPSWGAVPVAARYVIETKSGSRLVVYNVHMPTRRNVIGGIRGKGMLAALFGRSGGYGSVVRAQIRDFFSGQDELAGRLVERARTETEPVVLIGDFNFPRHGKIYRRFVAAFTDTFAAVGSGFGYSFPGKTNNPFAFFRPWLRIDHAFSNAQLVPKESLVESRRPSQHRAIGVVLAFPTR